MTIHDIEMTWHDYSKSMSGLIRGSRQFRIRVLDVDLARRRIDLSMRSSGSSTISARFATLQKLKNEIFPARVISVEDPMGLTNVIKCYNMVIEIYNDMRMCWVSVFTFVPLYLVDLVVAFVVFKETGAEVELRHPQTSVLGWLSNELQKGSKPLKPGEEIEAMGRTMCPIKAYAALHGHCSAHCSPV
jgi:hypothetical protein